MRPHPTRDGRPDRRRGPTRRPGSRRPRGQSIVEFALAIPIFLTLLFGTIEVGMAFKTRSAYQEAAQEAVRAGTSVGASDQDALNQVRTMLAGENLNAISSVTIYDATASGAIVAPVSPTVPTSTTYTYSPTYGFICTGTTHGPPCTTGWTVRNTTGGTGPLDRMGVEIDYRYRSVTGVLKPLSLREIATALLEPTSYGS